ncbi:SapC family protein [Sphingomonas sp. BAUL-RG-20F-R05-02]|uniref:SapC family protein n=1 Tax=Sphingomonas sp. BAUL-RG-20F-R05-02 TaxID=2914830 RepID=UPI0028C41793|nr:SapC family protein [Sphingomonas sp. BAUL-RG-20F-R05-02]
MTDGGVMTRVVLLDNVAHADLRVATGYAVRFGDSVNQCAVFPTEFDEVQREYPILLRKDTAGAFYAVALLGLDRDENLFLNDAGWQARHVPVVHQRGAFMIGMVDRGTGEREPMIHVDLDHPRVGSGEGQAVFLPHGGQSPYLDHIVRVLQVVHDGLAQRAAMFAAFEAADLIEPVRLEIALDEATSYDIPDCYTIGAGRLAGLDAAGLAALNHAGFLRHAFLIASSLGNIGRLIDMKNRRRSGLNGIAVAA